MIARPLGEHHQKPHSAQACTALEENIIRFIHAFSIEEL
jgi:hypothetical protein